jgi:hypothetical protein
MYGVISNQMAGNLYRDLRKCNFLVLVLPCRQMFYNIKAPALIKAQKALNLFLCNATNAVSSVITVVN